MASTAETPGSDAFHASLAGLVHSVEGSERRVAAAQIEQLRLLAAAGRLAESQAAGSPGRVREHDMILRSIAAELGGVMRVADRTVQRRISEARVIVEDFPGALAAWETGAITRGHVLVIVETGSVVPPELRAEFEAAAIARCERSRDREGFLI